MIAAALASPRFVRSILTRIGKSLGQPRIITGPEGKNPYLSRWYLLGKPRMLDGSCPFDEFGDMKPGVKWHGKFGLYLHRFHRSDADRELHNHPWRWACSLILAGGYTEERRTRSDDVVQRVVSPWSFNWIGHDDFHRVDLTEGDCWSLFLVGPKVSSWGFWDRASLAFIGWREFLAAKR